MTIFLMRESGYQSLIVIIYLQQELEDALILIHEKKIDNFASLVKVLELAMKVRW